MTQHLPGPENSNSQQKADAFTSNNNEEKRKNPCENLDSDLSLCLDIYD